MRFIDTNIFIRFLTDDDPVKTPACRALIEAAVNGQQSLITSEAVLAEVIFVLISNRHYGLSHRDASVRLKALLAIRGLHVAGKRLHERALDLFAENNFLDYKDALTAAYVEDDAEVTDLVSYDRDFDRLPGIHRVEP